MAWQQFRTALIWFIWNLGTSSFLYWPPPTSVGPSLPGCAAWAGWAGRVCILAAGHRCLPCPRERKVRKASDTGKGKALKVVCWAKPFSHGSNDPLHIGVVLLTPSFNTPNLGNLFKSTQLPPALLKKAFLFGKRQSLPSLPGYHQGLGVVLTSRFRMVRLLWNELMAWLKMPVGDCINFFLWIWARWILLFFPGVATPQALDL